MSVHVEPKSVSNLRSKCSRFRPLNGMVVTRDLLQILKQNIPTFGTSWRPSEITSDQREHLSCPLEPRIVTNTAIIINQ